MSRRWVLQGVPRIGYDIHLCPLPGALYAYLAYEGDPQPYDYLMGVTGAAFRRLWSRDDGGNVGILRYENEPFCLGFAALGYQWNIIPTDADKMTMVAAIKESLAHSRPVISFGIIGPPEPGLIIGYDQDGQVLTGWSYFQENRDHYYVTDNWFETMDRSGGVALLLIGEKQAAPPSDREILAASLRWALDLARTPRRPNLPDHLAGLAAYNGWANALTTDTDYRADDEGMMHWRVIIHGDQCVMLQERHEAAKFLRRMQGVAPDVAGHLEKAARCYDRVGDLGASLWPWPIDPDAGAVPALADPHIRRKLAGHVRTAKERETEAVQHLEQALHLLCHPEKESCPPTITSEPERIFWTGGQI